MCLFFALSAYLITELMLREKEQTGTVHMRAFYTRRILRIWPLYFAFIAFCFVLGEVHRKWHLAPGLIVAFSALAGNWYLIHVAVGGPVMPLWSISLEEQFYLIWPRVAKNVSRATLFRVAMILLPFSLAAVFVLSRTGSTYYQIWWNSFAQIQFFAIGGLLALARNHWTPAWGAGFRAAMLCLGIALWLGASYFNTLSLTGIRPPSCLVISYLLAGGGCVCLFLSCLGSPARWWPKQLLYLGKISYGLYVFHFLSLMMAHRLFRGHGQQFPFSEPLKDLLALGFALGFAAVSYKYLEKPFLALKEKFAFVKSRPA